MPGQTFVVRIVNPGGTSKKGKKRESLSAAAQEGHTGPTESLGELGLSSHIGIGIAQHSYADQLPGWGHNSVGFHGHEGVIVMDGQPHVSLEEERRTAATNAVMKSPDDPTSGSLQGSGAGAFNDRLHCYPWHCQDEVHCTLTKSNSVIWHVKREGEEALTEVNRPLVCSQRVADLVSSEMMHATVAFDCAGVEVEMF